MRRIRTRLDVAASLVLLLQVASAAVSSLNACCGGDRAADGPMHCCREGGAEHMCVLARDGTPAHTPSGELRATCPNGHDEGVPRGGAPGLTAARFDLAIDRPDAAAQGPVVEPLWRPRGSPSPPPRG